MKIVKFLIIIILFYLFALLQTSFLVHFNISGIIVNFILISVLIINICEKTENYFGLISALIGGFFLDIFSSGLIGFNILILLATAILIKFFIKKNVRIPFIEKF